MHSHSGQQTELREIPASIIQGSAIGPAVYVDEAAYYLTTANCAANMPMTRILPSSQQLSYHVYAKAIVPLTSLTFQIH